MALNGMRLKPPVKGELIAVLDVGTTKVVCFIARMEDGGRPRTVGIGHQVSAGLKSGAIIDMDAAATAIGNAVNAAERMANERIRDVVVNLSGGHPTSQTIGVEVAIAGHDVTDADLKRVVRACHTAEIPPESDIIHAIPVGYAIDGQRGVRDPRGMYGETLGVDLHIVTASTATLRTLASCIARCHLETATFVTSPYASGLACLVEDEIDLGCTVIDMGGGTTTVAVFCDGQMIFSDCIPVGGSHVTNDIARGLTTPVSHAERMKTLHGSCLPNPADDREIIEVPQVGEDERTQANHVPRSLLTGIIQPRMEEVFELVRGRLEASGFDKVAGRRVVLVGGASQLQGVRDMAQQVLDKQVRMGRPAEIAGLTEATGGPAFSTAVGLLLYATRQPRDLSIGAAMDEEVANGWLGRLGGWIRAAF